MNPQPLFLSLVDPLQETIKINGRDYRTHTIINALQKMTGQRITKANGRLVKGFHNVTLEFYVVIPDRIGQPLKVLTRNGIIEVW